MRRQRISTKGSHSFALQLTDLLLQELDFEIPATAAISGEPPHHCGEIVRRMSVEGTFSDSRHFFVYGEINRPARQADTHAWKRAVLQLTIGSRSWVAYLKRNPDGKLIVHTIWPLEDV